MLPTVLSMLHSAQQLSVMQQQSNDEESLEYNTSLRMSIFEAYSGIFNGLSAPKISQYLKPPAEVGIGLFDQNEVTASMHAMFVTASRGFQACHNG